MLALWEVHKIVVFCIPGTLLLIAALGWFLLRKTIRTRVRVSKLLRDDPDINEWLVVFDWSRKILYVPTILASIAAGIFMLFYQGNVTAEIIIGGCWLGLFFVNLMVDEYEISVKVFLIFILFVILVGLWLFVMGWLGCFLRMFTHLRVVISPAGYFVVAGIFTLTILVSWLQGLFYFVAISPNYLNIQTGPTETGEQINHSEYSTRVDTGDFLERIMGFGRIIVTFRDHRRKPMSILVYGIGKKAQVLESIRGKLSVDSYQANREPAAE